MKELFKKVFSEKISSPVFVGFGAFAIFTFIVFPGLTAANTILNIISALVGVFTLTFIFYYLKADKLYETFTDVEPGETELDYISPEELNPKKKRNPKQFDGVKSEEPFVKTRNKPATPYQKKPGTPVTPKMMGDASKQKPKKK